MAVYGMGVNCIETSLQRATAVSMFMCQHKTFQEASPSMLLLFIAIISMNYKLFFTSMHRASYSLTLPQQLLRLT